MFNHSARALRALLTFWKSVLLGTAALLDLQESTGLMVQAQSLHHCNITYVLLHFMWRLSQLQQTETMNVCRCHINPSIPVTSCAWHRLPSALISSGQLLSLYQLGMACRSNAMAQLDHIPTLVGRP